MIADHRNALLRHDARCNELRLMHAESGVVGRLIRSFRRSRAAR
jgi:hypothetical protein